MNCCVYCLEEATEVENGDGEEEAHEPTCFETFKQNFGRYFIKNWLYEPAVS